MRLGPGLNKNKDAILVLLGTVETFSLSILLFPFPAEILAERRQIHDSSIFIQIKRESIVWFVPSCVHIHILPTSP